MQTEAIFNNITERIRQELIDAKSSIIIAVAWFTNKTLFDTLLQKANEGCSVSLIISNDKINKNSSNNFSLLNTVNSYIYEIGDGDKDLMHNKFCVIDNRVVITGPFNWSYKAETNFENIVITYDDFSLAEQFIQEFHNIRTKYFPNEDAPEEVLPLSKVLKRLEIIKHYIVLEDLDDLKREVQKMKVFSFNPLIQEIIINIENKSYASAIKQIQEFVNRHKQLALWNNPEISALKLEINILENQLNAFANEKIEVDKKLYEFENKHYRVLGDLIVKILRLRKLKFKDENEKFKEAEKDEKEYNEQYKVEKGKNIFDISIKERKLLKKKWREASFLCHPDKLINEEPKVKLEAEAVFKDLNEAYSKNDLVLVSEILKNLKSDKLIFLKKSQITEKERLKSTINSLKRKIEEIQREIIQIRESETYKLIENIEDLNEYFNNQKVLLEKELELLIKETKDT